MAPSEDDVAGLPAAASTDDDAVTVDEMDSSDVAAAMGFSSFGAQAHPNKKRRFNPRADAVVARPLGTGANASPLPARPTSNLPLHPPQRSSEPKTEQRVSGVSKASDVGANADEIDLGDSDDDEPEPQYVDTSRPVGEVRDLGGDVEDPAIVQARIDDIVAAGNATYGASAEPDAAAAAAFAAAALPGQLDGNVLSRGHHQPGWAVRRDRHGFRPDLGAPGTTAPALGGSDAQTAEEGNNTGNPSAAGPGEGVFVRGRGGMQSGRGGTQSAHDWWAGYYDPTSNENPWAQLETQLGLPTPAAWLERRQQQQQRQQQQSANSVAAPSASAAPPAGIAA